MFKKVDPAELQRFRELECSHLLPLICDYIKEDFDFSPQKNGHSQRWHLNVAGLDFELLTTGAKFYDTHSKSGGGGGIDLVMHLFRINFMQAVKMLKGLM